MYKRTALFAAILVLTGLLLSQPVRGQESTSTSRQAITAAADVVRMKTNLPANPSRAAALFEANVIEIKFQENLTMRLRNGVPRSQSRTMASQSVTALAKLSVGGVWLRSHTLSEARLDELRRAGGARSGRPLPDLNSYMRLKLPPGMDAVTAVRLFAALDSVEAAYLIPKPVIMADVADYSTPDGPVASLATNPYQRYLDPAPAGIDARWAWNAVYGNGAGMRICDVEYDYNADHEDLPSVTYVGDPQDPPYGDDHGTAVLGVLAGVDNGWGVKGIAYGADVYFAAVKTTTGGYDVGNGVLVCMNALTTGDVILIEQQTGGPNYDSSSSGQVGLIPVEWYKPWYDDIVTAVANGMIVVEAGGNGSQDLDSADYTTGNGGHHPFQAANDSGAIIVGAGKSAYYQGTSARAAHGFSSYGTTVDLQGWGDSIVAPGYGDLYPGDSSPDTDQKNVWYRRSFGGTSGASPIVAAAAAIVQRNYKARHGSPASPAQIKQILQDTGTAQAGTKNIGPLPNLKAALQNVWGVTNTTVAAPTISLASGTYNMPLQVTVNYGSASQDHTNTHLRYTLDGSEPTLDSFVLIPEFGDKIYLNYGATVKVKAFQSDISTGLVNSSNATTATYVSSTPKVETPLVSPGAGAYSQPHQVTITTGTPGATIKYRTDGRAPSFFYPGTTYTGPITLSPGSYRIKARGYKDGYYKSDVVDSGEITVRAVVLPAPTIYPGSGDYSGSVTAYVGSTILGADIHYTTDGTDPTQSSPQFSEPVILTQTGTLKARVYLSGYTPSSITSVAYAVVQQVATPVISPPNGSTGTGSLQVSISTSTSGATIRYTTNGAEPTSYSTLYSGPFTLGVGEYTVKAKAYRTGATTSNTTTANFTVYSTNLAQVQAPVIDPNGGNHTGSVTIDLSTATEGASIYYILDSAAEPNVLYTGPVVLPPRGSTYSFRAKAKKTGMTDSAISTTSFKVFDPSLTGQIEVPDVTPPGGAYTDTVRVTVDGHTNPPFRIRQVYVTTNGQDPRPNSNASNHSSPYSFNLSSSATVKAIATQLGWTDSNVATNEYVLICDTPKIDPPGGTFTGTVAVTLSTSTPNSTLYYLTGEHPPNGVSIQYTGPFTLPVGTTTVWANCQRSGFVTSITAAQVFVVNEVPVAPSILTQPISQTVDAGTDVVFTVAVTGTAYPAIRWQFNGVDIAGETEEQLVIAGAQAGNAGDYRAIVENSTGVVTSTVAGLTINTAPMSLQAGWNLISFNVTPSAGNAITDVLAPIMSDLIVAEGFDGGAKSFYPGGSQNTLQTMGATRGYWLKVSSATTLSIPGTKVATATTPISLQVGWNLIGYLPNTPKTLAAALDPSIAGKYTAVLSFDQGAESWYAALPTSMNTLTMLYPYRGYWIYMTQPATLTYP